MARNHPGLTTQRAIDVFLAGIDSCAKGQEIDPDPDKLKKMRGRMTGSESETDSEEDRFTRAAIQASYEYRHDIPRVSTARARPTLLAARLQSTVAPRAEEVLAQERQADAAATIAAAFTGVTLPSATAAASETVRVAEAPWTSDNTNSEAPFPFRLPTVTELHMNSYFENETSLRSWSPQWKRNWEHFDETWCSYGQSKGNSIRSCACEAYRQPEATISGGPQGCTAISSGSESSAS